MNIITGRWHTKILTDFVEVDHLQKYFELTDPLDPFIQETQKKVTCRNWGNLSFRNFQKRSFNSIPFCKRSRGLSPALQMPRFLWFLWFRVPVPSPLSFLPGGFPQHVKVETGAPEVPMVYSPENWRMSPENRLLESMYSLLKWSVFRGHSFGFGGVHGYMVNIQSPHRWYGIHGGLAPEELIWVCGSWVRRGSSNI